MSGKAYRLRARLLHLVGLHVKQRHYSISPRCDWCGHRSAKQRAIAVANYRLATAEPPDAAEKAEEGRR